MKRLIDPIELKQAIATSTILADGKTLEQIIDEQPTVKPERNYDEWCLDCKEYDHDRHCCPRFNRVIGSVMGEIKTDRKLEKIMKGKHNG